MPMRFRALAAVPACTGLVSLALLAGSASAASTTAQPAPASTASAAALTKPYWQQLTPAQHKALAPLSSQWATITEGQKRKWLAVSENYAALPAVEQKLMHTRMAEWVGLTPQQRAQARLNFAGVRDLSADERLAKWETYKALSPEQKQALAASTAANPAGAATAIKPVAPHKLAVSPVVGKPGPKIATEPHQVARQTLLPQPPVPVVEPTATATASDTPSTEQ
jgi:hypothetical protein